MAHTKTRTRKASRPAKPVHELVTEGVPGGLLARCSCDTPLRYNPQPIIIKGRDIADHSGTFPAGRVGWALARRAHQRHLDTCHV